MLVYDQPINQATPDDRQAAPRMSAGFSVLQLTGLLWQRKIAIAMAGLILVGSLALQVFTPDEYARQGRG